MPERPVPRSIMRVQFDLHNVEDCGTISKCDFQMANREDGYVDAITMGILFAKVYRAMSTSIPGCISMDDIVQLAEVMVEHATDDSVSVVIKK